MHRRFDETSRLFVQADAPSWPYPVRNLGYEEVGEIVEVGSEVRDLRPGQRAFGTWGHRTHHVASRDYARDRLLPAAADPRIGIFSHIGAVALNGVHDAAIRVGDLVVVFGLGVPGQMVAQAARAAGATVIGVDPVRERRETALALGADRTLDPAAGSVAEVIKAETAGRGADINPPRRCQVVAASSRSAAGPGSVPSRTGPSRGRPPRAGRASRARRRREPRRTAAREELGQPVTVLGRHDLVVGRPQHGRVAGEALQRLGVADQRRSVEGAAAVREQVASDAGLRSTGLVQPRTSSSGSGRRAI